MTVFARRSWISLGVVLLALAASAGTRPEHVFIISMDGGKPAVMEVSPMPNLQKLVSDGAHTWAAETINPSVTLPCHSSMLTGVQPSKHKIVWNDWRPTNGLVKVPTVFALAKKQGLTTAMFVAKEKFRHLLLTNSVDKFSYVRNTERISTTNAAGQVTRTSVPHAIQVARAAAEWIVQARPNLCFVHFADPDSTGHKYGWGSEQQVQALANCDEALGILLNAIAAAGIADSSVVIVTADHGGHGRSHGSKLPDDKLIPWIVCGADVPKGFSITDRVSTCDTTATALWLLNVNRPSSLEGRPVKSAFAAFASASADNQQARVGSVPADQDKSGATASTRSSVSGGN